MQYKDYKIYLKRKYGNDILYASINSEEKLMKISNHLIKDMNCKLVNAFIEKEYLTETTIYYLEEPKGE